MDWILIGSFALLAAFDCLRVGARRISQLVLALPATVILVNVLPQAAILGSLVGDPSNPIMNVALFGTMFVVLYILVARIGLEWGSEEGQPIQAAVAGVAAAGIVVTFWIATPALDELWHFGPQVREIFGEAYHFWWLIGSYAALSFVRA